MSKPDIGLVRACAINHYPFKTMTHVNIMHGYNFIICCTALILHFKKGNYIIPYTFQTFFFYNKSFNY